MTKKEYPYVEPTNFETPCDIYFNRAFFNYSNCMSPVLENYCNKAEQLNFQGVDDAWQYMCENSTGMSHIVIVAFYCIIITEQ